MTKYLYTHDLTKITSQHIFKHKFEDLTKIYKKTIKMFLKQYKNVSTQNHFKNLELHFLISSGFKNTTKIMYT